MVSISSGKITGIQIYRSGQGKEARSKARQESSTWRQRSKTNPRGARLRQKQGQNTLWFKGSRKRWIAELTATDNHWHWRKDKMRLKYRKRQVSSMRVIAKQRWTWLRSKQVELNQVVTSDLLTDFHWNYKHPHQWALTYHIYDNLPLRYHSCISIGLSSGLGMDHRNNLIIFFSFLFQSFCCWSAGVMFFLGKRGFLLQPFQASLTCSVFF